MLGALLDSILECVCCGKGVLEVKCPYHLKDCCLDEVEALSNFYLTKNCKITLVLKQIYSYLKVQ